MEEKMKLRRLTPAVSLQVAAERNPPQQKKYHIHPWAGAHGLLRRRINFLKPYSKLGNFGFKKLKNDYLIANDSGQWAFLGSKDFRRFLAGKIVPLRVVKIWQSQRISRSEKKTQRLYQPLRDKGFVDVNKKRLADLAVKYLKFNYSLWQGPTLFIMVLTLRCNHRCLYCQVVPENEMAKNVDMTEVIAKKAVDLIFRTPSQFVRIEFQGGEPLLNWPVLKYIVRYAKELNQEKKKNLQISLVSNLTLLDDQKLKFLLNKDVSLCCSFDGPAKVHNKNRVYLKKGNSYQLVAKQIKKIQRVIKLKRKESKNKFIDSLNAVLTVSKFSLPYEREIIDEYIKMGFDNIFIRPLSRFGLSKETLNIVGYGAQDFIDFYQEALDYILQLNLKGRFFMERTAYYALKKIIKNEDANFLEMRSPCGAGIGQIAFNYDGRIFTCDEGRMAWRLGYKNFKIGDVEDNDYNRLIDNEVVKTMCLASCLDNHVACSSCVYKPYCGICPLANFIEYGTIFPQISNTDKCKINQAMFDYLFSKIKNKKYRAIFENWLARAPYLYERES